MKVLITTSVSIMIMCGFVSCTQQTETDSKNGQGKDKAESEKRPVFADSHNSRNSLDWSGVYQGIIPCADCDGIKIILTLKHDNTYTVSRRYLGRDKVSYAESGTFSWNEEGSRITTKAEDGSEQMYQIGENVVFHLDRDGNRISGDLAENYALHKNRTDPRLEDKQWILSELMGEKISPEEYPKQPFLLFDSETSMYAGNGSCNNLFGSYELKKGDRIIFGESGSTMMACPDMSLESNFLEMLKKVDNYSVTDSTLTLNRARMAPLARFFLTQ